MNSISIIDSHTGGEPTRLILDGGPDLGSGPLAQRLRRFEQEFDHLRSASVCEPRGSDVIVGALLVEPHAPDCSAGLLFFNNTGYLGMCGHGLIGCVVSLAHLGKLGLGKHRIDTPVGVVEAELHDAHSVTIWNVPAYRYQTRVAVEVAGIGRIMGDIAWGGNWFFLVSQHGQELHIKNATELTDFCWRVRQAVEAAGLRGANGAIIDHVELFGPPDTDTNNETEAQAQADSRNFVLCPGRAYDRSPCGTGTSAKLACLAADGKLAPGALWRQQSITGSIFTASYQPATKPGEPGDHGEHGDHEGQVLPCIRGQAYVTARTQLLLDPQDPLLWGIR